MFDWLSKIINWIKNLWASLPDSIKEKIIESIVNSFEAILREFYQASKQKSEE